MAAKIITHANMRPLLDLLQHESEFQCGTEYRATGKEWYREIVTLEFPLGELAEDRLKTMALIGLNPPAPLPLTGKEGFNAQGLGGKAQVRKDLFMALMNLRDLLPEERGRIIRD
jgi:hypothetical protein